MRVKIKNLARIKEASVALKPLTIFIGKNNTNKSYVAHVFYALLDLATIEWEKSAEQKYLKDIIEQLKPFFKKIENQEEQIFYSFRKNEKFLNQIIEIFKKLWSKFSPQYLKNPTLEKVSVELENFSFLLKQYKKLKEPKIYTPSNELPPWTILLDFFRDTVFIPLIMSYFNFRLPFGIFYFPASRTGFALALEDIVSGVFKQRFSGIPTTKLTEPTVDFLATYNDIRLGTFALPFGQKKEISPNLKKINSFLERKLLDGKVIVKKETVKGVGMYRKFVYQPRGYKISLGLHCVSSLVTELAPLYSFLNALKDVKNTFFIIEEPESHLHPSAQLEIVKLLGMLVRSEAKVLITTHSYYILNFVNVLIRSSQLEDKDRRKLKLEKCFLNPEEVGCYLFKEKGRDVEVKELEVSNNGVTTESFEEVLDEIIGLSSKIHKLLYKEFIKK